MWINAEITEKRRGAGEKETEQGFRKGSEPGSTDLYLSLEEPESVIWELSQSCNCPSGKLGTTQCRFSNSLFAGP